MFLSRILKIEICLEYSNLFVYEYLINIIWCVFVCQWLFVTLDRLCSFKYQYFHTQLSFLDYRCLEETKLSRGSVSWELPSIVASTRWRRTRDLTKQISRSTLCSNWKGWQSGMFRYWTTMIFCWDFWMYLE